MRHSFDSLQHTEDSESQSLGERIYTKKRKAFRTEFWDITIFLAPSKGAQ